MIWGRQDLGFGTLPLLVVVDFSSLGLEITNLTRHGGGQWGIKATPSLPEKAKAGSRRIGDSKEGAVRVLNLGLPKLIQIAKEFQHARSYCHRSWQSVGFAHHRLPCFQNQIHVGNKANLELYGIRSLARVSLAFPFCFLRSPTVDGKNPNYRVNSDQNLQVERGFAYIHLCACTT
ncbi:hypothetical protein K1719_030276 [Acacia pycnantha]|nr:hypothetical protein K1719_030276 [Acacia pycnantha]